MELENIRKKILKYKIGQIILKSFSYIYLSVVQINLLLYKLRIRKQKSVDSFVVCIGNITAGGTGKTPTVLLAARLLSEMGLRVAVISRGYKRTKKGKDVVVLYDQENIDWQNTGDEPYMMNLLLKEKQVPVIVSKSRYKAAKCAKEDFKSQVILLDDGFQHHKLKRNRNIVLIDAQNPFTDGLLPYGNLREPLTALRRADLILLTHSNLVSKNKIEDIKKEIHSYNPSLQVLEATHKPKHYFDLINKKNVSLYDLKGAAACFCGLGDPKSFETTLKNLGLDVKKTLRFADHKKYTISDIKKIAAMRGNLPLITTFKDYVKLPAGWQEYIKNDFYMLEIEMHLNDIDLTLFKQIIKP